MANRVNLKDLEPGMRVAGSACVRSKQAGTTRRGDSFLTVELGNRTGAIKTKIWPEALRAWDSVAVGAPIELEGEVVQGWQGGAPELRIQQFNLLPSGDPIALELNPHCPIERDVLEDRFNAHVERISRWQARYLLNAVLDHVGRERYDTAPAALKLHHNYISGLLEHSIEVADIATSLSHTEPYHELLDIDALIVLCLLHDIGKCFEYEWTAGPIRMSSSGRLSPHVCRGTEIVAAAVAGIGIHRAGISPLDYRLLQHAIASHHMTREWGSPVPPRTPEALLLHISDLASSRLKAMADDLAESPQDENHWVHPTGWNRDPVWHFREAIRVEEVLGRAYSNEFDIDTFTADAGGSDA